jgi:hypothetical protein
VVKRLDLTAFAIERSGVNIADNWNWLLRAASERPRCRYSDKRDELAPPHGRPSH